MNKKDFLFLKRKRESKGKVLGACSKEGAIICYHTMLINIITENCSCYKLALADDKLDSFYES